MVTPMISTPSIDSMGDVAAGGAGGGGGGGSTFVRLTLALVRTIVPEIEPVLTKTLNVSVPSLTTSSAAVTVKEPLLALMVKLPLTASKSSSTVVPLLIVQYSCSVTTCCTYTEYSRTPSLEVGRSKLQTRLEVESPAGK